MVAEVDPLLQGKDAEVALVLSEKDTELVLLQSQLQLQLKVGWVVSLSLPTLYAELSVWTVVEPGARVEADPSVFVLFWQHAAAFP